MASLNKEVSELQEKQVSSKINGKITVASGGTKFNAGDIETKNFLIECKTKTKESKNFTIKKEWLDKINEQSFEMGKDYSALAFRFSPYENKDYFVVNEKLFQEIIEIINQQE